MTILRKVGIFLKERSSESGQSAALFALLLVGVMGFTALSVDVGRLYLTRAELQNAADSAALAAAYELPSAAAAKRTAEDYAAMNVKGSVTTTPTTPYQGDSGMIEVVCTETVPLTFARVLGFSAQDVSARAVAASSGSVGAFGYALFSGDPNFQLAMYGSRMNVGGGVHANGSIIMTGSNEHIAGVFEAQKKIEIYGADEYIGGPVQAGQLTIYGSNLNLAGGRDQTAADYVEMPDFSDLVRQEAQAAGQVYHGNQTFNGCSIHSNKPIYIDGDLTINGDDFSGSGVVLVKGNITFNGCRVTSGGSAICFYTETGNIEIHGDDSKLSGMLYAPKGQIRFNGSRQSVSGRVIGNQVFFSGDDVSISGGGGEIPGMPKGGVRLAE